MIICPNCHHESADDAKFCGNCATPLIQTDTADEEDSFVGKCIDNKYFVQKRIASGGMGVVYLARQKGVGQEVAIKKLHPQHYQNKKIVQRFINEARSYAQISHPNAVKLHDLLNINGQICIVMEFVHGKTLTDYVESGFVFSTRQIVDISLQLADALATVHKEGIIHRDLKTENVMLLETIPGRFSVKILDFGIAKILDRQNNRDTQNGLIVGTPEFMSPEQCYGKPVDYRTDIYAFGILMYVMICGKLPFEAESAITILHKQIHDPMPRCTRPDGSEVSESLEAIVEKCTVKDRENRYQQFADVITDLMCVQEGKPLEIAQIKPKKPIESESESPAPVDDVGSEDSLPEIFVQEDDNFSHGEQKPDSDDDNSQDELDSDDDFELSLDEGAQPKQSFVFLGEGVDSELNQGRITKQFSLDLGETEVSEFSEDEFPENLEFTEKGEFSLGDIDELDIESEDESYSESKSPMGIVMAVIILAGLAGIAAYFYLGQSAEEPVQGKAPIPTALESSLKPEELNLGAAKGPAENLEQPAEVAAQAGTSAPKPIDEKPEIEAPPSQIASRLAIERGVLRATMTKSELLLNNGEISEAEKLAGFFSKKKEYLAGEDASKFEALENMKTRFSDTLKQAEKAKRDGKCEKIQPLATELPETAIGMREVLDKLALKCNQIQAAPPSTL